MTLDPSSILLPLRRRAADLAALRSGEGDPATVTRVAAVVEESLRRLLRDDPEVPLPLRLAALSSDDLPAAELLAELRRRDRIPIELAAAVHDLGRAVARMAERGAMEPRDAALAAASAEGVEARVRELVPRVPVVDPVVDASRDAAEREPVPAPPLPPGRRVSRVGLAALAAILLLLALAIRLRGGEDLFRQGEAAYREGRISDAEQLFRRSVEASPDDPLPRIYLARIYRDAGRPAAAAAEVEAGLRASPRSAGLHVERGFLLLDAGSPAEAIPAFREALRHEGELPRAWAGLVRALREADRGAEAEEVLRLAPAGVRTLIRTADERARAAP